MLKMIYLIFSSIAVAYALNSVAYEYAVENSSFHDNEHYKWIEIVKNKVVIDNVIDDVIDDVSPNEFIAFDEGKMLKKEYRIVAIALYGSCVGFLAVFFAILSVHQYADIFTHVNLLICEA